MKKRIVRVLIIAFCLVCIFSTSVFADVGSFESYSGGGSSSSSSSWGSSSRGSYSSSSSGGTFLFFGDFGDLIVYLVIIAIIWIATKKTRNRGSRNYNNIGMQNTNYNNISMETLARKQTEIENTIQAGDPNFNAEELVAWSKNLFIKLQNAWTARDWQIIRSFETESLFEQHKNQLQGYIDNKQINVMDRICVNYAHLYKYRLEGVNNTKLSKNAEAFLKYIEENNYTPIIYSCNLPLKHIWSKKIKEKYKIWLAQYDNNIDLNYDMIQYTSKGKVDGIKGNVDLNYANFKFIKRIVDTNDPNEQVIKNTKITRTNDYVITTTFANFRKAPTFELNNILTDSLAPNTKLKRLGTTDNDWSKVEYNGQIGYVYNYYLKTS